MIRISILLICLLPLAVLSLSPTAEAGSKDIELELIIDKTSYMIHEPIWIDILVLNHGDDTVNVPLPNPEFDRFHFTVVQNGIDTLPYMGNITDLLGSPPSHDLVRGDTLYGLFNLLEAYRCSKAATHLHRIPLQGEITVSACFYPGPVVSNTLNLTVAPASEDETGAYELFTDHGWPVLPGPESIDRLTELINRYPNSVYAPRACRILQGTYGVFLHDVDMRVKYLNKVLDKYPNSGYVGRSISIYLDDSEGAEREAKLDSLMTDDKPFRLRMIAKKRKLGRSFYQ